MTTIDELLDETEVLLQDILLSGFQGIHQASLKEIDRLLQYYEQFGMMAGMEKLMCLKEELFQRKNSFSYDVDRLMKQYSQLIFYIEMCRSYQ